MDIHTIHSDCALSVHSFNRLWLSTCSADASVPTALPLSSLGRDKPMQHAARRQAIVPWCIQALDWSEPFFIASALYLVPFLS